VQIRRRAKGLFFNPDEHFFIKSRLAESLVFSRNATVTVGSVCSRCVHLRSQVGNEVTMQACEWLERKASALYNPKNLLQSCDSLSLPQIMFFELGKFLGAKSHGHQTPKEDWC